jgi:peroxiredoxin
MQEDRMKQLCTLKKTITWCLLITCAVLTSPNHAELVKGEAPNFTLKSLRGDNLKLSEHRGEVIMLNFWATWCETCLQSMPVLNDLYLRYRDEGFTLFSINTEKDKQKVRNVLRDMQIAFPVLFDVTHKVSEEYEVDDMPATYIIDKDGNLRYMHSGFEPGYEDTFHKQVRELMEEWSS